MAEPVVVLESTDGQAYKTQRPGLEFTGTDAEGSPLQYGVRIRGSVMYDGAYSGLSVNTMNSESIAYGGGKFMSLGGGSPTSVLESYDGKSWTYAAAVGSTSFLDVKSAVSDDGSTFVFIYRTSQFNTHIVRTYKDGVLNSGFNMTNAGTDSSADIVYGGGLFVACKIYGSQLVTHTSPDGLVWTERIISDIGTPHQNIIARYLNGKFMIMSGYRAGAKSLLTSYDGISWEIDDVPSLLGFSVNDLSFSKGYYAVSGDSWTSSTNRRLKVSPDGLSWSDTGPTASTVTGLISVDDVLIARRSGTLLYISDDGGLTFDTVSYSSSGGSAKMIYGNSMILIAGTSSVNLSMYISIDSSVAPGFEDTDTSSVSGPFPSGNTIKYTSPSNLNAGVYTWSARAIDPGGDNEWGDWAATKTFEVTRPPNPGIFMQFLT